MRPIDADALKKALEPYRYTICGFEGVLALIDDADTLPQVTVFTEDTDKKAIEDLKAELQSVIEGEWISLKLAKEVIAKFKGYLDDDMIGRIQYALEKENEAKNGTNEEDS